MGLAMQSETPATQAGVSLSAASLPSDSFGRFKAMGRTKLLLVVVLAFAAALALACGDDGGPGSATTTPPAGSPEPVFSCSAPPGSSQPDDSAFPVILTDDKERIVTLNEPPRAIASLSAGHTEMLYAMGAGDQVTTVDNTSDCPDAVSALPHVDAFTPSLEAITDLQPDLVVLFYDPSDLITSLQQLSIPVLFLNAPDSIVGVYSQIGLLGEATGHPDEAGELADRMEGMVNPITEEFLVFEGPRIYHELDNQYHTAGPGSFIDDIYATLGAQNIAESTEQAFPQLSAEAIIAADPEVIVLADEDAGESPETVAARPGWSSISAVQNGRIYIIDPDIVSRPGPRLIDALLALGHLLYPQRFP